MAALRALEPDPASPWRGSPPGHVIYEGASARPILLVVFAYLDQPVGTRSHATFLRDVDCKKLFLNPGRNAWYQTGVPGLAASFGGLVDAVARARSAHPGHEVLCLGHSMGAFAALGVGVAVGAERILASAPEYVLNRRGSLSAAHLGGVQVTCGDLGAALAGNAASRIAVLVGQENPLDMAMAAGIAALTPTEVVTLPCGHGTFPYLRDQGRLGPTLRAFVEGRPIRPCAEGHDFEGTCAP